MKNRWIAVLLTVVLLLTLLPAGVFAASAQTPSHTPKTYSFKWSDFYAGCQEMFLFKGDTLIYEPEPYDAAAYAAVSAGQWLTMSKGFYLQKDGADATASIATINEVSPYSGQETVYTSITITSDRPVHLSGSASFFPISSVWNDAAWKGLAYRGMCISFDTYDTTYPISYTYTVNSAYPEAQLYGNEADPTSYDWSYEEYDLSIAGKPVVPGLHFSGWKTGYGQDGIFFTPIGEDGDSFHANPPVLWSELLSGWRDGVIFEATYSGGTDCGTVTLNANGGSIEGYTYKYYEADIRWQESTDYQKGSITGGFDLSAHTPTREGASFGGWYADAACTKPVNETADISYSGYPTSRNDRSVTLYARWTYRVTTRTEGNGTVQASAQAAAAGEAVTLTATPDAGWAFAQWQVVSGGVTITDGQFTMPAQDVTVQAVFKPAVTFTDVPAGKSYTEAVSWAVANGITRGTSDTAFSPDATCTRGQVVTFLWRAAGEPTPKTSTNPFTDVAAGTSYYAAILWAVEEGITSGTSKTTFSPAQGCTRAQVATFLWRAAGKPTPTLTRNPFTDVAAGAFYYSAVLWAVEQNITLGTGKTTFSPGMICTRGQIVTFLWRDLGDK